MPEGIPFVLLARCCGIQSLLSVKDSHIDGSLVPGFLAKIKDEDDDAVYSICTCTLCIYNAV